MDLSNHHQPYANASIAYAPTFLSRGTFVHLYEDYENDMSLKDLSTQIEMNQVSHATFVLGQNIRYVWDATIQFFGDIYSSFKNTRAGHFINEEDFDYEVHQNINAETC